MSVEAHIQAIRTRLLADTTITSYEIIREQSTVPIGQMRARLTFIDGSWLEFSEVFLKEEGSDVNTVAYSYHWMESDNQLKMRWDNAKHYPDLPGFPHHLHAGDEKNVLSSEPMSLFKVLDYIADNLKKSTIAL